MRKVGNGSRVQKTVQTDSDFSPELVEDGFDFDPAERWFYEEYSDPPAADLKPVRRRIEDWWESHDLDEDLPLAHNHRRRTPKRTRKYASHKVH